MNSDVLRDMMLSAKEGLEIAKEKQKFQESQIVNEDHAIEHMMSTDGWKIMDRDLGLIQEGLLNKLRFGNSLTKAQMDRYIDCINLTEQFRKNPTKYVIRMKMLIKRKQKGV